ncbi:hypothetical protein [Mesorhizobium sp. M0047]|uniref:hypothetical protein n=1 Tax=Mesorhizobium sp. M0047 TaxID=2956859 RepID=UPI00333B7E8D
MRTIELKAEPGFDYRDVLLAIVKAPMANGAQGGTQLEAMRADIRLLDKLEPAKPGDKVDLEDADWGHVTNKIRTYQFAISDRRVVQMCDEIIGAEQTS